MDGLEGAVLGGGVTHSSRQMSAFRDGVAGPHLLVAFAHPDVPGAVRTTAERHVHPGPLDDVGWGSQWALCPFWTGGDADTVGIWLLPRRPTRVPLITPSPRTRFCFCWRRTRTVDCRREPWQTGWLATGPTCSLTRRRPGRCGGFCVSSRARSSTSCWQLAGSPWRWARWWTPSSSLAWC